MENFTQKRAAEFHFTLIHRHAQFAVFEFAVLVHNVEFNFFINATVLSQCHAKHTTILLFFEQIVCRHINVVGLESSSLFYEHTRHRIKIDSIICMQLLIIRERR